MSQFRKHLQNLNNDNKLITVSKELSVDNELSAGIYKAGLKDDGYAVVFENVKDFPGWKVAGSLFSTQDLLAYALNVDKKDLLQKYIAMGGKSIKPNRVETSPVKEVIIEGKDVDLSKIPFLTYCEDDESAYHHSGIIFAKDEDNGVNKGTIKRMEVLNSKCLGIYTSPYSNFSRIVFDNENKGVETPIAIAIGTDPEIYVTSQFPNRKGVGCIELAGGLRNSPIDVIKCETLDMDVPAGSEIILEGVITKERVTQGVWGTERGNYVLLEAQYTHNDPKADPDLIGYTFKVTAITHRKNPIYLAMTTGYGEAEDRSLCKYLTSVAIYQKVVSLLKCKEDFVAVNVMHGEYAVVSIRNSDAGTARRIIHSVTTIGIITKIVVVDEDIDVNNLDDVNWAIVTRTSASKDIVVYPSTIGLVTMDKWGIDATAPVFGPIKEHSNPFKRSLPAGIDKVDYI